MCPVRCRESSERGRPFSAQSWDAASLCCCGDMRVKSRAVTVPGSDAKQAMVDGTGRSDKTLNRMRDLDGCVRLVLRKTSAVAAGCLLLLSTHDGALTAVWGGVVLKDHRGWRRRTGARNMACAPHHARAQPKLLPKNLRKSPT